MGTSFFARKIGFHHSVVLKSYRAIIDHLTIRKRDIKGLEKDGASAPNCDSLNKWRKSWESSRPQYNKWAALCGLIAVQTWIFFYIFPLLRVLCSSSSISNVFCQFSSYSLILSMTLECTSRHFNTTFYIQFVLDFPLFKGDSRDDLRIFIDPPGNLRMHRLCQ